MRTLFKQDKGVAGLNILLTVVIMLFIIGFIVMIFAILGGQTEEEVWTEYSGTTYNDTLYATQNISSSNYTGFNITHHNQPSCNVLYVDVNDSMGCELANFTIVGCKITYSDNLAGDYLCNNTQANVTYTWTAYWNSSASQVIFDVTDELETVTDWFGIIIVITAMVVLILLTVIIIQAIRGSGLIAVGGRETGTPIETA